MRPASALALVHRQSGICTPRVVRNGREWRQWRQPLAAARGDGAAPASLRIALVPGTDRFETSVSHAQSTDAWTVDGTVTEHGHQSRVTAGENAGVLLKQDFLVRQYVSVGRYTGAQTLRFNAVPASNGHPRQINLVVSDPQTGEPLQALSLACG